MNYKVILTALVIAAPSFLPGMQPPSQKNGHKRAKIVTPARAEVQSLKNLCLQTAQSMFRNCDVDQQAFINAIASSVPNHIIAALYNRLYSAKIAEERGQIKYVELISPRKASALTPKRSAVMLRAITTPRCKSNLLGKIEESGDVKLPKEDQIDR